MGGTIDSDDWYTLLIFLLKSLLQIHALRRYPTPRPEITKDILNRVLSLCPDLAPPEIRATRREPKFEDLQSMILEEGCGLRPARAGGVRIELEWFEDAKGKREVPVIHNYGHGGFGYQSSWGSASEVLELLSRVP